MTMLRTTRKLRTADRLVLACFLVTHAVFANAMSFAAANTAHGTYDEGTALIICTDDGFKQIVLYEGAEKLPISHECLCPAGH